MFYILFPVSPGKRVLKFYSEFYPPPLVVGRPSGDLLYGLE